MGKSRAYWVYCTQFDQLPPSQIVSQILPCRDEVPTYLSTCSRSIRKNWKVKFVRLGTGSGSSHGPNLSDRSVPSPPTPLVRPHVGR